MYKRQGCHLIAPVVHRQGGLVHGQPFQAGGNPLPQPCPVFFPIFIVDPGKQNPGFEDILGDGPAPGRPVPDLKSLSGYPPGHVPAGLGYVAGGECLAEEGFRLLQSEFPGKLSCVGVYFAHMFFRCPRRSGFRPSHEEKRRLPGDLASDSPFQLRVYLYWAS